MNYLQASLPLKWWRFFEDEFHVSDTCISQACHSVEASIVQYSGSLTVQQGQADKVTEFTLDAKG